MCAFFASAFPSLFLYIILCGLFLFSLVFSSRCFSLVPDTPSVRRAVLLGLCMTDSIHGGSVPFFLFFPFFFLSSSDKRGFIILMNRLSLLAGGTLEIEVV